MTQITNQRSYPLTIAGRTAQPGESIELDGALAKRALKQPDNWAAVKTTQDQDQDRR